MRLAEEQTQEGFVEAGFEDLIDTMKAARTSISSVTAEDLIELHSDLRPSESTITTLTRFLSAEDWQVARDAAHVLSRVAYEDAEVFDALWATTEAQGSDPFIYALVETLERYPRSAARRWLEKVAMRPMGEGWQARVRALLARPPEI